MHEFKKKIDELLEDNIISSELHAAAIEIVNSQKSAAESLSQRLAALDVQQKANAAPKANIDKKGKGKAIITETGNLTPVTADSDGDVEMREATVAETPNREENTERDPADPPFDQCYCGQDAATTPVTSGIIICSDVVSCSPISLLQ